jgi:hypothetical protein
MQVTLPVNRILYPRVAQVMPHPDKRYELNQSMLSDEAGTKAATV